MKSLLYILSLIFIALGLYVINGFFCGLHLVAFTIGKVGGNSLLFLLILSPLWRLITSKATLFLKIAEIFCIYSFIFMLCAGLEGVGIIERGKLVQKMQFALVDLVRDQKDAQDLPEKYTQKEYGEFAYALNVLKDTKNESRREIERLDKIIEKGRFPEKLLIKNLVSLKNIKKGLVTLKVMEQKLNTQIKFTERSTAYEDFFISSPTCIDQPYGRDFFEGYAVGRKRSEPILEELFCVERAWMREVRDLFIFLEVIQGTYSYKNEQIIFESTTHLKRFNSHMENIQKFFEEEGVLVKKIHDSVDSGGVAQKGFLK